MQQYLRKKKKSSSNKVAFIGVMIVFILGLSLAYFYFTNKKITSEYLTPLKVQAASSQSSIKGLGTIKPSGMKLIAAPVDSTIEIMNIREGQRVGAGDLLIQLNNEELVQKIQETAFDITVLESKFSIEKSDLNIERSKFHSELLRAKTHFAKLQLELEANKKLQAKGIISQIKYQKSELAYAQAKLEIDARTEELSLYNDSYEDRLSALSVNVSVARKKQAYLLEQQSRLKVIAHEHAIISKVHGNLGSSFKQGAPLLELIEGNTFLVEVQVPQYSTAQVKSGLKAKVTSPNGILNARVNYVDTVIRNGASTVFLDLDEPAPEWLRPEQSVEAEIYTDQKNNATNTRFIEKPVYFSEQAVWHLYEITPLGHAVRKGKAKLDHENPNKIIIPETFESNFVLLLPSVHSEEVIENVL